MENEQESQENEGAWNSSCDYIIFDMKKAFECRGDTDFLLFIFS